MWWCSTWSLRPGCASSAGEALSSAGWEEGPPGLGPCPSHPPTISHSFTPSPPPSLLSPSICRDYVKKVAVYKDRVAVQLSDRIIIYETVPVDDHSKLGSKADLSASAVAAAAPTSASTSAASTVMYRVRDRIMASLECNLLVVTSSHVVLCLEKKLALYSFGGIKEREWVLEAVIRYIKVVGGPPGGEGLLVGLKNGVALKVFLNNPFPVTLVRHTAAIRCLDLSMSRQKLAIVDEQSALYVYDCRSGEPVWSESNAASAAWNAEFEDMLCYSGNG